MSAVTERFFVAIDRKKWSLPQKILLSVSCSQFKLPIVIVSSLMTYKGSILGKTILSIDFCGIAGALGGWLKASSFLLRFVFRVRFQPAMGANLIMKFFPPVRAFLSWSSAVVARWTLKA
jgi:hypothetical protein